MKVVRVLKVHVIWCGNVVYKTSVSFDRASPRELMHWGPRFGCGAGPEANAVVANTDDWRGKGLVLRHTGFNGLPCSRGNRTLELIPTPAIKLSVRLRPDICLQDLSSFMEARGILGKQNKEIANVVSDRVSGKKRMTLKEQRKLRQ